VIIDGRTVDAPLDSHVAIVGSGPAGIVLALELAEAGLDVLLLESGRERFDARAQALSDAAWWDSERHAPMALAVRRQVGGTSAIWGGRCVPYDPVDFEYRPWIVDHRWAVSFDEVARYFPRACEWFACGRAVFDATQTGVLPSSIVPGLPNGDVQSSALERWSRPTQFGREYRERLRRTPRVRLVTGVTCTAIVAAPRGEGVDRLACRTLDGRPVEVRARRYVLACGGIETTRLLLASRRDDGCPIGNHSDHLGRWYMGHLEGVVAAVRFRTPPEATIYGYERDADGTYVRRRLTFSCAFQRERGLPNVAGWLVHPEPAGAHGSGVLSVAYLALASPLGRYLAPEALRRAMTGERVPGVPFGGGGRAPLREHLRNIVRDLGPAARFVCEFGVKRFLARGRRAPGFAVYNPGNVYPLQYHAEHLPRRDSRVTLDDSRDELGVPRVRLEIRYGDRDVEGVAAAHAEWDAYLRRHGVGWLEYGPDDLREAIRRRMGGGFHQIGTTRMSERPEDGVVDRNLAVHGCPALSVASSSVFPTSGQANSTFMIVVFALRLADHLKAQLR